MIRWGRAPSAITRGAIVGWEKSVSSPEPIKAIISICAIHEPPLEAPEIDQRLLLRFDDAELCQCHGGVSRSPAAALLCLATWTGEGNETYCVDHLLRIRSCAAPLRDLIRHGDALLDRGGKLGMAIDALRRR